MNSESPRFINAFVRCLSALMLVGAFFQSASAYPRIFTTNPAFWETYHFETLCDYTTLPDLIYFDGIVKMIHRKDPNTITADEYQRFMSFEQGSLLVPRQRLYEFSRRFRFGGKSFLNWIRTYRNGYSDTEESLVLKDFVMEVVIRSGRYNNGYCTFATSFRRMGGQAGSGSLLPIEERFTLFLGYPTSSLTENN